MLELVDIKQQHEQLLHSEVKTVQDIADLRADNESLTIELDAVRSLLERIQPQSEFDGGGQARGQTMTERTPEWVNANASMMGGEVEQENDDAGYKALMATALAYISEEIKGIELELETAHGDIAEVHQENEDLRSRNLRNSSLLSFSLWSSLFCLVCCSVSECNEWTHFQHLHLPEKSFWNSCR